MLKSDKIHIAVKGLRESMKLIAVVATMPWLLAIASKIPGIAGGYNDFVDWSHRELHAKKKVSPIGPRLSSALSADTSTRTSKIETSATRATRKTSSRG